MNRMDELKVVESGLVPVYEDNSERKLVNARELYLFLNVGRDFSTWFKKRVDQYKFSENEDYRVFPHSGENPQGGRPAIEYLLTVDMAKELAMVENNDRGRQVRKYFIECERRLKSVAGTLSAKDVKDAEKLMLQAKRVEVMERNAKTRQAQLLKSVADSFKGILSNTSLQALASEVTKLIAGKKLIDEPEVEKLYSVAEIEEMCGINASMIDFIVNEYDFETEDYGKFVLDKMPYNPKRVSIFRYNRAAVDKIQEFLDSMKDCLWGDVTEIS